MSASDLQIGALHRYFIWSLNMRDHFRETGEAQGPAPKDAEEKHLWLIKPFMYMCLWFSLLFVVVEGYRDLGLSDPAIDAMLTSPHVEVLRRFRNGALHYQRDYFDRRFRDFMGGPAMEWAHDLHTAFSRFFLRWFEEHGMQVELVEEPEV
jgi:hypothetical protein